MKNIIILIAISIISNFSFSQKVKIKNEIATVDGEQFLNWHKSRGSEIAIWGLKVDSEEISAMYLNYSDPNKITDSNPEGKVRWIELNFLTLDKKCEVATSGSKGLVKLISRNNLYVDGTLNEENVGKFVKKYGTRFSENRPGGNINIIINN